MGAEDEPAVQDVDVARTPPVRRGLQSLFSLPFLPQITSYISNLPARRTAAAGKSVCCVEGALAETSRRAHRQLPRSCHAA